MEAFVLFYLCMAVFTVALWTHRRPAAPLMRVAFCLTLIVLWPLFAGIFFADEFNK